MPDSYTREVGRFSNTTIIMGLVAVCVLMAVVLLGAGMLDTRESPTQLNSQAPVTTQPSSAAPATGENKAP